MAALARIEQASCKFTAKQEPNTSEWFVAKQQ